MLYFCIVPSLTGVQVLVCGSVLLRLLQQQAAGLLQTEPGDERYRGERLAGEPFGGSLVAPTGGRKGNGDTLHAQDVFMNRSQAHLLPQTNQ